MHDMGCTDDSPCRCPALRWVHSATCQRETQAKQPAKDHRPRDHKRVLLHDFLDSLTEIDIDDLRGALMNEEHAVLDRIVDAYLANRAKLARSAERKRR